MPRTSKPSAITTHSRQMRQQRAHGKNAKCKQCGETNPAVLVFSRPKLCETCFRRRSNRTTSDDHHPAGAANSDFIVALPANVHRIASDLQNDWEPDTLQNPEGDPLRFAAASIRGFGETCKVMIDHLVFWVAELLEILSEWLRQERGPQWWIGTPAARFAPPTP
jgi:hypothetical protein